MTRYIGDPPGSLRYQGEVEQETTLNGLVYSPGGVEELIPTKTAVEGQEGSVTWVDYIGLSDVEFLRKFGEQVQLSKLSLEDILTRDHRPKVEFFDGQCMILVRMITADPETKRVIDEPLSLWINHNRVIVFQEREGDIFGPIRERIHNGKGRIRKSNAPYLAYCMLDVIVEYYAAVSEHIGQQLDEIESRLLETQSMEESGNIHQIRNDLRIVRRAVQPVREILMALHKNEQTLFDEELKPYLKDVEDQLRQVQDSCEALREQIVSLFDFQNANQTAQLNEVMKLLTVLSSVFIPISFIAGVLGMNINMSFFNAPYATEVSVALMASIAVGMLGFFKWKKWI